MTYFWQEQDKVEEEIRQCNNDFKLMEAKCLVNAKGSFIAMRDYIEAGILLAASRPKNEQGIFCEGESICRQFCDHPVFKLDLWSEDWFRTLSERVRNAELQEQSFDSFTSSNMNDWSMQLKTHFEIQLEVHQRENRQNHGELRSRLGELCDLLQQRRQGDPTDHDEELDLGYLDFRLDSPININPVVVVSPEVNVADPVFGALRPQLTEIEAIAENEDRGEKVQQPKKRKRPTKRIETGGFIQSEDLASVKGLWTEYAHGLNGGPAVRDLEKAGTEWRADNARRQFYNSRRPIYVEIERLMETRNKDEMGAIDAVEKLHDNVPRKGKRSKHALKQLGAALRCFHMKHQYTGPYTLTKMPSEEKISQHLLWLGNYEF
ncbi:MAG: transcription activator GCR1-like domain-containing protein [bacterium]